jgi:hypothetical protein
VENPSGGNACAWPDLTISRDDALPLQIAQDHVALVIACERSDEQGLDGGELGKERE